MPYSLRMNIGTTEMDLREDRQIEIALKCQVALTPRAPQVLDGVTEQIGPNRAVILLDPDLPMPEWPRVGDLVIADCEIPKNHNSRYKSLKFRGRVTRILVTEDGSPRLEVELSKVRFWT